MVDQSAWTQAFAVLDGRGLWSRRSLMRSAALCFPGALLGQVLARRAAGGGAQRSAGVCLCPRAVVPGDGRLLHGRVDGTCLRPVSAQIRSQFGLVRGLAAGAVARRDEGTIIGAADAAGGSGRRA